MKTRIIGLSLVFAALTSETVAQPVQHYYDESTAAFYDQYPKASYLSVDEMKKAFEQHSQGNWMQQRQNYVGFFSRDGRVCTMAFEPAVFKNNPLMKSLPAAARFVAAKINPKDENSKSELALVDVVMANGEECSLTDMKKKYGVTVPNDRNEYEGGDARVPWLSGTYVTLEYPLPYMGFVVSANRRVSQFENGRLKNFGVLDSYDSRFAAFERGSSFVISLDGPWYQKLDNTMRLFSYESRHYLPQDATQKAKAGISFDLLLTIDRQGRLGVEVLRPKQLSEDAHPPDCPSQDLPCPASGMVSGTPLHAQQPYPSWTLRPRFVCPRPLGLRGLSATRDTLVLRYPTLFLSLWKEFSAHFLWKVHWSFPMCQCFFVKNAV